VKIAKAFGFKVPPRVSLNVGVGVGGGAGAGMGKRRRRGSESDEESDMDGEHEGIDGQEDGGEQKRRRKEISAQNGSGQQGDGSVSGPMRIREEGWSNRKREEVVGKKRFLKERNFRDQNTGRGKFAKNWSR
jgi:ATP-dependent RNA helicase DDX18/HAS1